MARSNIKLARAAASTRYWGSGTPASMGLGEILDPAQVRQANAAIYKYNYIPRMGDVYNPCRIYCLNDEGGLVICAWPRRLAKAGHPSPLFARDDEWL